MQAPSENTSPRRPLRDPLADRLIGPGRPFEIERVTVAGIEQQVFKGAPRNLAAIFAKAAGRGSQPMIVHDTERLTYGDVFARAAALSHALRSRFAIGPGSTVAIVMANRSEWVISLIAVTAAGAVAALVNSRGAAEEMLQAIATAGCNLAILDGERAETIAGAMADPAWPRIVIDAPAGSLRTGLDTGFAELARPRLGQSLDPLAMDPEDGAVILYTSGTTGHPKGALLSHGAMAHAASLSEVMGTMQDLLYEMETGIVVPPDRRSMAGPAMVLTPMFHLTGMLPVVRGMALGATIHIMAKWNTDVAFDMIERSGLSRIALVPTMLWDMLQSPRSTPETLSAIRSLAYGGGPLNTELVAEIRRRMPRSVITNTYGQSENAGWACSLSGQAYLDNPQSCGWACPTVDVMVRRLDGSEADPGEPGELWVRSASVMTEYIGNPQATAAALIDGWCATGDLGTVDDRGLFTILDRKNDMVISGGENVYCAEIERVLFDHPAVREAIAYGLPDDRLGEIAVATAVLAPGSDAPAAVLEAYCRERLAHYKVPRRIEVTRDALPRTATGKIDRGGYVKAARDSDGESKL